MRIETICTGDELLTGLTSDTNSRFFQELLLDTTGLTVRKSVVVGDDAADIEEALNDAAARCDFVLVSGGLGPTSDDLTAECAARAAQVPLVEHPEVLRHMEARFAARRIAMSPNNRRQALVPQGAEVVLNQEGTAPMFIQRRGSCTLFFVPGVPVEYKHLVSAHVVPRMAAAHGATTVRKLTLLKTMGVPESHLDERLRPLHAKYPFVTFGFRTHPPENHIKLLAQGATEAEAAARLDEAVPETLSLLADGYFGRDDDTIPSVLLATLRARNQSIALAESCTGGLATALLTAEPGASDVVFGGACTYQNQAKVQWAHVPSTLLEQHGAVSSEVAAAMAEGIRRQCGTHWGLSITGWAGPTGGDALHPIGTVFVGVSGPSGTTVKKMRFWGDRARVRHFAALSALAFLRQQLQKSEHP